MLITLLFTAGDGSTLCPPFTFAIFSSPRCLPHLEKFNCTVLSGPVQAPVLAVFIFCIWSRRFAFPARPDPADHTLIDRWPSFFIPFPLPPLFFESIPPFFFRGWCGASSRWNSFRGIAFSKVLFSLVPRLLSPASSVPFFPLSAKPHHLKEATYFCAIKTLRLPPQAPLPSEDFSSPLFPDPSV